MNLKNNKDFSFLIFLFGFSLFLRLAYLFFLKNNYLFFDYPGGDVSYYLDWSREIAAGNWIGHQVFWGMPLYAYVLAVFQNLTLGHIFGIHIIQIMIGSCQPVLVFLISGKLFNRKTAILASLLTAVNFLLIDFDCLLMPTSLIATLSLLIVWLLLQLDEDSGPKEWLALGILVGITSLGDGKFLIFFALCVFILWKEKHLEAKFIPRFGAFAAGTILIVGLVAFRNCLVGGKGILISAQSGLSFYSGNHRGADGIFDNNQNFRPTHAGQDEDQKWIAEQSLGRPLSPKEISSFWMNQGLNFIRTLPGEYGQLLGRKLIVFWTDHEGANDVDLILKRDWKERLDLNPYCLIIPLAGMGLFLSRANKGGRYLSALLLSQMIFTLIFFLTTKHRATILPVLLIYESAGLIYFVDEIRQHRFKTVFLTLGWMIVCWIVFMPVQLSPRMISILKHSWTGFVLEKKGGYEEAGREYEAALQIDPHDANLYFNLGNTQFLLGKEKEAAANYQECLNLNPNQVDCFFNLGAIDQKDGRNAAAVQNFEKALTLTPQSPDIHFRLAQIAVKEKNCTQAKNHGDIISKILGQTPPEVVDLLKSCPK